MDKIEFIAIQNEKSVLVHSTLNESHFFELIFMSVKKDIESEMGKESPPDFHVRCEKDFFDGGDSRII